MSHGTTPISTSAHEVLRQLSKAEGTPMLVLLDEAVEALRRQRFLAQVDAAYATLRADPRRSGSWNQLVIRYYGEDALEVLGRAPGR